MTTKPDDIPRWAWDEANKEHGFHANHGVPVPADMCELVE